MMQKAPVVLHKLRCESKHIPRKRQWEVCKPPPRLPNIVSVPMPKVAIRHIGMETYRAMVKWITPGTLTPTFVGSNPTSPAR